jgi:TPP-dependent indolepyruvate ferredoxin oxidoreductase alpha subunit
MSLVHQLTGIDAIVNGLTDGGAEVAYNFPGFTSQDIFRGLGGERISLNERVAYAEAFGASLAGKRSVVSFKNVGLNIASDAYLHSVISGVRAGLVVVVTDDIAVWGSQESQDSRSYFDVLGGIWFEPTSLQDAYDISRQAFIVSERLDVPIVIRLTNALIKLTGSIKKTSVKPAGKHYQPISAEKFVVHPVHFKKQHANLIRKNTEIQQYCNNLVTPSSLKVKHDLGKIIVGCVDDDQLISDNCDVFMINTYPIPELAVKQFVAIHKQITVIEYGCDFVAQKVRSLTNNIEIKSVTPTELGNTKFGEWKRYNKFFSALKSTNPDMVISDITQFTVEDTHCAKAALSLGVAVSTTIGYAESQKDEYAFCLSGDCSFLHEGIGILQEGIKRHLRFGLIIFDNGGAWCTGGQENAGELDLLSAIEDLTVSYTEYENTTDGDFVDLLNDMKNTEGISVLILKTPMGKFERD